MSSTTHKKGRFSAEWIQQLKQTISLVDVASENIELKKTGNRFMGRCPFHGDRSPSFSVNRDFYYCFGCKETGDIISFVTKLHGLSFEEACEDLAEKANLTIPESAYQLNSEEEKALYQRRLKIQKASRLNHFVSLQYYHKNLVGTGPASKNPLFQEARDYLKKRGISQQIVENFQIGVSGAATDGLVKFLTEAKAPLELGREFGLIRASQKQVGDYDFFRERVLFPLIDMRGRICGFGGRILPSADERLSKSGDMKLPKYLNSAENELFHKSKFLYGLYQAKRAIREEECVIIVEGYFDVVSLHQAGIENVVATCGTSLTDEHLKILSRLAKRVIVFFDQDSAGVGATIKAMELGLRTGVLLYGISFKGAKDPDEFLLENPAENVLILKKWIEEAHPLLDHSIETELKSSEGNMEARSQAVKKIAKWLQEYSDEVGRSVRVQDLITRWKIPSMALGALAAQGNSQANVSAGPRPTPRPIPNLNGPVPNQGGGVPAGRAPQNQAAYPSMNSGPSAPSGRPPIEEGDPGYGGGGYGARPNYPSSGNQPGRSPQNSGARPQPSGPRPMPGRRPPVKPTDRQLLQYLVKFSDYGSFFMEVRKQLAKGFTLGALFEDREIQEWVDSMGDLDEESFSPDSIGEAPISQELRSLILESLLRELTPVELKDQEQNLQGLLNRGIHRSWAQFSQQIKQAMVLADSQQDMEKFKELSQEFLDLQRKLKDFEDSYVSGKSIDSSE